MKVTGLTLEGFQVFKQSTSIPITAHTLLYGPNSSGKSAVSDALQMIYAIARLYLEAPTNSRCDDGNVTNEFPIKQLNSHWRKEGEGGKEPVFVENCVVGIDLMVHESWVDGLKRICSSQSPLDIRPPHARTQYKDEKLRSLSLTWRFIIDESECSAFYGLSLVGLYMDLSITLDGIEFVTIEDKNFISINTELFDVKSSLSRVSCYDCLSEGNLLPQANDIHPERPTASERNYVQLGHALIIYCMRGLAEKPIHIVPASRQCPSPKDLTYFFPLSEMNEVVTNSYACELFNLSSDGLSEYAHLALSLVGCPEWDGDDSINRIENLSDDWNHCSLADTINHSLSNDLFNERGYRLSHDVLLLQRENADWPSGFYVRVFLKDALGKALNFTEVGSGLGYLLPVLVSAWQDINAAVSVIHQPELHLHPAMQANMADVFINAANANDAKPIFLVETHSEHLLLRMLKRIRQTSEGKLQPEYKITPDQVTILYFDPSPDGTTSVRKLRISPDGEFLDRWPRGFFAERDQELFDE